jgi:hypothetical protein
MARRLLLVNVLLGALGLIFLAYIVREVAAPAPQPQPLRSRPTTPLQPAMGPPPAAPGAYMVVASRNLFSPSRTESGDASGANAALLNLPKPNLFGVVLRDGAPIAYLEDPVTKRVAGYRVGDSIGGGTLKSISADRVILTRPEGNVDVQLHDPARPRAAAPVPGQPGAAPSFPPGVPPQQPSPLPGVVNPTPPTPPAPGQPAAPTPFGRRPLRPNLQSPNPAANAPSQ